MAAPETTEHCGFSSFLAIKCGTYPGYDQENDFVRLKSCTKDIRAHLLAHHIPINDVRTEWQLISLRSGIFDLDSSILDGKLICATHRYRLGLKWNIPKGCKHPMHSTTSKGKPYKDRAVSLKMSREAFVTWNHLIPIGSGICRKCYSYHNGEMDRQKSQAATPPQVTVGTGDSMPPPPVTDTGSDTSDNTSVALPTRGLEQTHHSSESEESPFEMDTSYAPTPAPRNLTLQNLNDFLKRGNVTEVRGQLLSPLNEMASNTRNYYKRKAREGIRLVLHCLAPGQEDDLMETVLKPTVDVSESEGSVVQSLVKCYLDATSSYTKRQILSILATDRTKTELQKLVPGLSLYRIDKARDHTKTTGKGLPVEMDKIQRNRLDDFKIDHFIDFVSRPEFLQDVAYGTKKIKLSHGEKLEIPNVVRSVVVSRLIDIYLAYCQETNFVPLGKSTLFSLIQVCAASQKQSLAGLDNIAAEGSEAFNTLFSLVDTLGELGMSQFWVANTKMRLQNSKHYLKTDYKLNVTTTSHCADHCITFALSEKQICSHEHDMQCMQCEEVRLTFVSIDDALKKDMLVYRYDSQKDEINYDFDNAKEAVTKLKSHLLRAKNQERAKNDILGALLPNQAHITMDWAMKFLPQKFREPQQDWFGKKGVSWHITAVVTKNDDGDFQIHCFVHMIDRCTQDWFAVLSALEASLTEVKARLQRITEVFLRSDNAGCYHCAPLILAIPSLSSRIKIHIKEYHFSKAQAGKDLCDRKIAPMKAHIGRYINEGHDVTNASEMYEALDSYGGVRGCYPSVMTLDDSAMTDKVKWEGITSFTDFDFSASDENIKAWHAYKIGEARQFSLKSIVKSSLVQGPSNVKCGPYSSPRVSTGSISSDTYVSINCVETSCIKTFSSQEELTNHLTYGKHLMRPVKETKLDEVARKWASKVGEIDAARTESAMSVPTVEGTTSIADSAQTSSIAMGWALKTGKARKRFSEPVKNFLLEQFMKGVNTGKKEHPVNVAKRLKSQFSKVDWLTSQQITSYFSRLAAKQKAGHPLTGSIEITDENDKVAAEQTVINRRLRSKIIEQCEL